MLMIDPSQGTKVAEAPTPVAHREMMQTHQFCECPRCETRIPAECVLRHEPTQEDLTFQRTTISIWCPACLGAFRTVFVRQMGLLHQIAGVSIVTDPTDLTKLRASYERLRGDRQQEPRVREPSAREMERKQLRSQRPEPVRTFDTSTSQLGSSPGWPPDDVDGDRFNSDFSG